MDFMRLRSAILPLLVIVHSLTLCAEDLAFNSRERALLDTRLGACESYSTLIPSLIEDLKRSGSTMKDQSGEMLRFTSCVIDYAHDLETGNLEDADRITVQSEKYWRAVLVLTANDDTALFTRLVLLMREGLLRRAKIVLLYCAYDQNKDWERDALIINTVLTTIREIESESNRFVEEGIRKWDEAMGLLRGTEEGNRRKGQAAELYYRALEIYPKNPWAWWEISQSYMGDLLFSGRSLELVENNKLESYYGLIRHIDPLYKIAFLAGKRTPDVVKATEALSDQVGPSFENLWNGKGGAESMRRLADGFYDMEEYELALYAYKFLLFRSYKSGFDQELVNRVVACLGGLNMEEVAGFLLEWLGQLDKVLKT